MAYILLLKAVEDCTDMRRFLQLICFSVIISFFSSSVLAANLVVTSTDYDLNEDDDCTFQEALQNVNDSTDTYSECGEPDSSDNTIVLSAGTYCVNEEMTISADVSIEGDSSTTTIIDGGNDSDESDSDCQSGAGEERVFKIDTEGLDLSLIHI